MFLTGIPSAIVVAVLAGLVCRMIGMGPRAAKPVILISAFFAFSISGIVPSLLAVLLTP